MKRKLFFAATLLLGILGGQAKVVLPDIVGNNMVLQQNTKVKLWGKAKAHATLSVKTSWNSETYTTKVETDGKWTISIPTPKASFTPQTIKLSDGEVMELTNILIGEVWFCSGQSNMEMPLNGFTNCPILGANETIAMASKYKAGIRVATIAKKAALTPQESCEGKWMESTPENAQWFSATAFHFATTLFQTLNIPVGIINCSWGGSTVEGWLPKEILNNYSDIDIKQASGNEGPEYMKPMIMYNGMLKPLQNYTIKGFLWYQGESNLGKHNTYAQRLATMVNLWREEWGQGTLPFYFVEIAPYEYGDNILGALLREAQFKAQELIPSSGMISTNDLVEPFEARNIHPRNKTTVGKRLCYLALTRTYGVKGIVDQGPIYQSMEIKDGKAIISFSNAPEGFSRMNGIEGFEVAGADKVFYPAVAVVDWNKHIIVSSDQVPQPVAVRYAFKNFQPGNLHNHREQPVFPFRTDNW